MENTGFTLEGRVLCQDEACIGVIGPDRRCKECGAEYTGDEPIGEGAATESTATDGQTPEPADTPARDSDLRPPVDLHERVCCPDEACIGIIGPDGKCGTCGTVG